VSDARRRVTRLFLLSAPITWWILVNVAGCGRSLAPATDPSGSFEAPVTETQPEERGKAIYLRGRSPSGVDIKAVVGDDGEVPASLLACVNCHGRDGRSKSEGGMTPSVLAWEVLTRPYGTRQPGGREHPPYDERSLIRAITLGIDSGGKRLQPSMPRYRLSHADAGDLVAYIKRLGDEHDPGLSQDLIKVGAVLASLPGPAGEAGRVVKAALTAYFEAINGQGGIFGRRIQLEVFDLAGTAESRMDALRAAVDGQRIFALVGSVAAGDDEAIARLAEGRGVPLIGPVAAFPREAQSPDRYVFYLVAGFVDQGLALLEDAVTSLAGRARRAVILHHDAPADREMAARLCDASRGPSWASVGALGIPEGSFDAMALVRRMQNQGVSHVVALTRSVELSALVACGDEIGWEPTFLVPFSLVGTDVLDLPAHSRCRLVISHPALLPRELAAEGARVAGFAEINSRPAPEREVALAALASAVVFIEGLKKSGRGVNRESFVDAIETLSAFRTGLTPPLTFGRSRHIGSRGTYLLSVDLTERELRPTGWVEARQPSGNRRLP
jgi:ABC-type branched-subunit amino acid transport system substrate-binding protein/cytochrome c553